MPQQAQTLILIVLMVVAFYFLILRPQKKRQQAVNKTQSELGPGVRVMLTSGIFATVVAVGDRQIVVEISPGVELTILKQAIARTVTDADEDIVFDDEDDDLDELDQPAEIVTPGFDRPTSASTLDLPSAGSVRDDETETKR